MIAMVLAAGLGTRLRPLTERIAKPALPVLGTTLLEANLRLLAKAGVKEVVVNAHHRPETVAEVARRAAAALGLRLHLSIEQPVALGTGGALVAARPLLDRGAPFLLINGDVLCDLDLRAAWEAHTRSGAEATMVLRPMPEGGGYGGVEIDGDSVIRIAGHGLPSRGGSEWLFAGVHVLGSAIFETLPAEGESCVNRQGHALRIAAGAHVHAHVESGGRWSDVGTPERYVEANLDLLEGRYALDDVHGGAEDRGGGVRVHPSARVESGAELVGPCWIGPRVRVAAGARVGPRAVVHAGAEVHGAVSDSVVAPDASVEGELHGRLAS